MTPTRLLDVDGSEIRTTDTERWWSIVDELSDEQYIEMLRSMVLTRAFDTEAGNLQRQGKLGLWVPSIGQEGGQAGVAFAMRDQDTLFPSYREHLMVHNRGVRFAQIIDIFRGATHGGWDPAETRGARLYSLVIGTQSLHGTGYAMGVRFDGASGSGDLLADEAVVVCYGDGASSQGDANEALIFAASYEAPVLFMVQNNKWAISVPSSVQSRTSLARRASGFGVSAASVDGNDALASYAVSRSMLDAARSENSPQYLELDTYRIGAHTTSDDPTKYRSSEELESWKRRDPIERMRGFLNARGVGEDVFSAIDVEAKDVAAEIRRHTLSAPTPSSDEIFDFVYSDANETLEEQKLALARFEASFGSDE